MKFESKFEIPFSIVECITHMLNNKSDHEYSFSLRSYINLNTYLVN